MHGTVYIPVVSSRHYTLLVSNKFNITILHMLPHVLFCILYGTFYSSNNVTAYSRSCTLNMQLACKLCNYYVTIVGN